MLELAEIAADPNAVLSLAGPGPMNGHTTYALTVTGHWTDLSLADSPAVSVTFFIDSTTYNVVAREDTLFTTNDSGSGYDRTIGYDDYRASGSFTVPFTVTETVAGQLLASTKWTTLTAAL